MLVVLAFSADDEQCKGTRKPSVMDDEIYNLLVQMKTGNYGVPVKERTKVDEAAYMRLYRYGSRLKIDGDPPKLYIGKCNLLHNMIIITCNYYI